MAGFDPSRAVPLEDEHPGFDPESAVPVEEVGAGTAAVRGAGLELSSIGLGAAQTIGGGIAKIADVAGEMGERGVAAMQGVPQERIQPRTALEDGFFSTMDLLRESTGSAYELEHPGEVAGKGAQAAYVGGRVAGGLAGGLAMLPLFEAAPEAIGIDVAKELGIESGAIVARIKQGLQAMAPVAAHQSVSRYNELRQQGVPASKALEAAGIEAVGTEAMGAVPMGLGAAGPEAKTVLGAGARLVAGAVTGAGSMEGIAEGERQAEKAVLPEGSAPEEPDMAGRIVEAAPGAVFGLLGTRGRVKAAESAKPGAMPQEPLGDLKVLLKEDVPPAEQGARGDAYDRIADLRKRLSASTSPDAKRIIQQEIDTAQKAEGARQKQASEEAEKAKRADALREDADRIKDDPELRDKLMVEADRLSPVKPPEGVEVGEAKPEEVTVKPVAEETPPEREAVPTAGIEVGEHKLRPMPPEVNRPEGEGPPTLAGIKVGESELPEPIEIGPVRDVGADPQIDQAQLRSAAVAHGVPVDAVHMQAVTDIANALHIAPKETVEAAKGDPDAFHAKVKSILAAKQKQLGELRDELERRIAETQGEPPAARGPGEVGAAQEGAGEASQPAGAAADEGQDRGEVVPQGAERAGEVRGDTRQAGETGLPAASGEAQRGADLQQPEEAGAAAGHAEERLALQPRSRDRVASVAQMQRIAGNPDPDLLGASRSPLDGAPMASSAGDSAEIPEGDRGKHSAVTFQDGRKVPVRYAVVEAGRVHASHDATGRENHDYGKREPGQLNALNNGRTAALQEAYRRGTAENYRKGLEAQAEEHGVSPEAIRSKKNPMLVRLYGDEHNTADIGAASNEGAQLSMSPVEQARADAARINLEGAEGDLSPRFLQEFMRSVPANERGGLMTAEGRPTKQLVDRARAAVFMKAYGDERLLAAMAEETDPESRNLLSALVDAAPEMGKIENDTAGVRRAVTDAAELLADARRRGLSFGDYDRQAGMFGENPKAKVLARFFARSQRSPRKMGEALKQLARTVQGSEHAGSSGDMFGAQPELTFDEAVRQSDVALRNEHGQEAAEIARPGDGPDGGTLARRREGGKPGQRGGAAPEEPAAEGRRPLLEPYTEEDLQRRAAEARDAEQRERDERARADADRERAGFTLTGSDRPADVAAAKGQGSLFRKADGADERAWEAPATGRTADDVRRELWRHHGRAGIGNLEERGILHVVNDYADAPAHVQEEAGRIGGVSALHDPKTGVWIFANRTKAGEAVGTLHHEVGEHFALRRDIGEEKYGKLLDDVRQAADRSGAIADAWNQTLHDYHHLDEGSDHFVQEVMARIAETDPKHNLTRRLINLARSALYKMGLRGALNDDVIRGMVVKALRREMTRGPESRAAPGTGVPLATRRQQDTPEFKRWFGGSKVVDESGAPKVLYHGAKRPDRIGERFRKSRATSGPMAFFTDDPAIASKYAEGKEDTSHEPPADYAGWFKYKAPGSRSEVDIDHAWYQLTPEQRTKIADTLPHVSSHTPEGEEMPNGEFRIGGPDEYGLSGRDHWQYEIRSAQGNVLKAAKEIWLAGGNLFNNEHQFMDVLKLGGMPMSGTRFDDPWASHSAVLPVYLSVKNPLVTTDIPERVITALEQAAAKSRSTEKTGYGTDVWNKGNRGLKEWVEILKKDQAAGKNSYVWSSIPDKVTEVLKSLGYDGINDTGGKGGGDSHHVWIPFEETQVKSAVGNSGTFDPNKSNILARRRDEPEEPDVTGIKNAQTDIERAERNLPAVEEAARRDFGTVWDEAKPKDERDWQAQNDLVEELKAKPRAVTDKEDAVLLHRQITLQNEYDEASRDLIRAHGAGDEAGAVENRARVARLSDDLLDLYNINKRVGTETARGLNARRMMADADYSLAAMTVKMREAVGGRQLTPDEQSEVATANRRIRRTQAALDDHLDQAAQSGARSQTDAVLGAIKTRLRKRIDELEQQIAAGVRTPPKDRTPVQVDEEATQLRARRDALKKQFDELFGHTGLTDEQRLTRTKAALERSTEILNAKALLKKFEPVPRAKVSLDAEALRLKSANDEARLTFERAAMAERLKQRSAPQRVQDALVKWRRAFLLSSPVTLAKLTSAAVERVAFTPIEEAAGAVLGHLPGVSKVAARAPREGGINVRAEARALREGLSKGMTDAWMTLATGHSELDNLFGKQDLMPREVIDMIGSMHGALKAPVKRAEFERSLEKRIAHAMKNGVDPSDPMVQTSLMVAAYKDAQRSIFMQDNRVVQFYKRGLTALEQADKKTGKVPVGAKAAATAMKLALPIVRVPTNIVAETLQYALGSVSGSLRLGRALYQGVEKLHPDQADLIMRELKKGSLGAALLVAGYMAPEMFGGYYEPGDKSKAHPKFGTMRIAGWEVPTFLIHNPLLETLQIGATVRHVADSKLRMRDPSRQGLAAGVGAALMGLIKEVPFVREMTEIGTAMSGHDGGRFWDQFAKDLTVPMGVQWVAQQFDKDAQGNLIPRDPKTMWQSIETGLPGLRQRVPRKQLH